MFKRLVPIVVMSSGCMVACGHNPYKAEKIETKMEKAQTVQGEQVGVKDGNVVVQKKVEMADELRRLQIDVFELEDRVYGNRKYGSMGLYGSLRACRIQQTSKELGGDGKLMWTEPIERVSDREDEFKIGVDERDRIVGVNEEFLSDRIGRFKKYRQTLQKRQDDYEDKLEICDAAVKAKRFDRESAKKSEPSESDNDPKAN